MRTAPSHPRGGRGGRRTCSGAPRRASQKAAGTRYQDPRRCHHSGTYRKRARRRRALCRCAGQPARAVLRRRAQGPADPERRTDRLARTRRRRRETCQARPEPLRNAWPTIEPRNAVPDAPRVVLRNECAVALVRPKPVLVAWVQPLPTLAPLAHLVGRRGRLPRLVHNAGEALRVRTALRCAIDGWFRCRALAGAARRASTPALAARSAG